MVAVFVLVVGYVLLEIIFKALEKIICGESGHV